MRVIRFLLPGLGLLLLGGLVGALGVDEILHNLAVMRWAFLHVVLLALAWHVTNSLAWSCAFPADGFRPRLPLLFMCKLAGEAVNQLTPLANLGGEPLKAFLLRRQSPVSRGLASVVVNKAAQVFTGLLFTAAGLGLVTYHWEVPLAVPMPVRAGLTLLLLAAVLLTWSAYRSHRRMFSALLVLARRCGLGLERIERLRARAAGIDHHISRFFRQHKGRFGLVLLFHACGWLLGACETFVILRALGAGIDFEIAFLIASLTVVINGLFFFMPSNIGVLEGGQVFLFLTLGLDPAAGLSLGIVKRMRKLLWISVGWLFLTHLSRSMGRAAAPVTGPVPAAAAPGAERALRQGAVS